MKYLILTATLLITSCAAINPLDIITPKPNIDATVQIGKENKNEENFITVNGETSQQEAETISNTQNYTADKIENITQQFSKEVLILVAGLVGVIIFLAGWVIPTPKRCSQLIRGFIVEVYKGIRWVVIDVLRLITVPIKAFGEWCIRMKN